jgi:cytoskeletal protein CcmA (bactofilin family)
MNDDKDFRTFHYNVIGKGSLIIGELNLSGDTIINSHVEGNINITNEGKLIIERGSHIKGKIISFDLDIFGQVEGEIVCKGLLSIRSSGVISGKVQADRLVIYPGAEVEMMATTSQSE